MKKISLILGGCVILLGWMTITSARTPAGENSNAAEYVTLRWDGRDNTHVIRPGGNVENLGSKFKGIKKPDRTDERSFFMNLAMNALANDGYELVAMTPDDYVFRRAVKH